MYKLLVDGDNSEEKSDAGPNKFVVPTIAFSRTAPIFSEQDIGWSRELQKVEVEYGILSNDAAQVFSLV